MLRLILRSLTLLSLLFLVSSASAQHLVLFETFTNSYDLCPQGNVFDQEFKQTLQSDGSKVIHLNHHIGNIGDPMAQSGGANGSNQVAAALSGGNYVFMAAVDRTDFGGTTGSTTTSQSEWESRISTESTRTPAGTISLVDATFDKTTHMLHAIVQVTSVKAPANPVSIHYAITQDNVAYDQCAGTGPSTHNNVVRYITVADSAAIPGGSTPGQTFTVEYNQFIKPTGNGFDLKQMKLIAFLQGSGGHVENVALLKKDLDTLRAPVQTLEFVDTSINGKLYHPGDVAVIQYHSSNVQYADAFYSLDNGTTWHGFATSVSSPINWTVPDSATTQGKFKLVGPDETLIALQTGNFTIAANAHSLTLLHPTDNDTAHIFLKYMIQWRKVGFDAVKLEYTVDGGAHWTTIAESVTDTFYNWTVPNVKTNQAQIRITALGVSDVPSITSPQFTITGGLGAVAATDDPRFAIASVYPNPAVNSGALSLQLRGVSSSAVTVQVLDLLGHEQFKLAGYAATDGTFRLPTATLAAGTYIVRVSDGLTSDSKRVVIE